MSFYLPLAALIQTPKRVDFSPPCVVLYNGDPNIALGTSEPSDPTLSIQVSVPTPVGDALRQPRYLAVIVTNTYNGTGATNTVNVRVRVDGVDKGLASRSPSSGYYSSFVNASYVNPNSVIGIYAWGSASGFYLRTTFVAVLAIPKVSSKLSAVCGVRVASLTVTCLCTLTLTAPGLGLAHDDVIESSLGAGFSKLTNVAAPTIYADEIATYHFYTSSSINSNLTFIYPMMVVWTE
jgi:hypothetical protein